MPKRTHPRTWNPKFPHVSSIAAGDDSAIYVSSLGRGVYRIGPSGEWSELGENWPAGVSVNRLQMSGGTLYACTSQGLLAYKEARWTATELAVPVYRIREVMGGRLLAATQYGVWCRTEDGWLSWAYSDAPAYDLLYLPQYIIVAREKGIALYDRLTGSWADLPLPAAVTSVAVYRGILIGTGDRGELIVGNRQGGFAMCRFEGLFLLSLIMKGREVYACSDRGLFRIGAVGGRFTLLPVRLGFPVADADWAGDTLVLATLFESVQTV